jgi:hypothetical protein
MIDVSKLTENLEPRLANLVAQFRRIQVSKFPLIAVEAGSCMVRFIDSRFQDELDKRYKVVGMLFLETRDVSNGDSQEEVFVVQSRLINIGRYNSDRKHQKITKDDKKTLKNLQDYIRPFGATQIADRTKGTAWDKLQNWKWGIRRQARESMGFDMDVIYEEVKRMKDLGLRAQTEKFQKAMDEGVAAFEENKLVDKIAERDLVHAFINPDGSIEVRLDKNAEDYATKEIRSTYSYIDEMPYELSSKIAMLRMTEAETFVPYVGVKVDDRTFWLHLES